MSIGSRIKQARIRNNMSLRKLSEKVGVSAMAISKYERDEDVPSSKVLIRLSKALNVKVEYFFRPDLFPIESLSQVSYRKHSKLGKKILNAIKESIKEWLERYIEIETIVYGSPCVFKIPKIDLVVNEYSDIEKIALDLRNNWELGMDPIDNITLTLEDKNIKILILDTVDGFDACTFWVNKDIPVIVIKSNISKERQRFNLAHELGHLLLKINENLDEEKVAHRFAGAFLIPKDTFISEIGPKRKRIGIEELRILKQKYGISMQSIVKRARDLNVISQNTYKQIFIQFRTMRISKNEPGDTKIMETSSRFEQLVLKALSEELISQMKAAELLGVSLQQLQKELFNETKELC